MNKIEKTTIYLVIGLIIISAVFVLARFEPSITAAIIADKKECVREEIGYRLIEESNCTRVYEDQNCMAKGFVEIYCPKQEDK